MKIKFRNYLLIPILLEIGVTLACSHKVQPETPCYFLQNENHQRVSWTHNLPITLYLDTSVPQDYYSAIYEAVRIWNDLGQNLLLKDFFSIDESSPGSPTAEQDGFSKIYFLDDNFSIGRDKQAKTTVYWTGKEIYEADVCINYTDFNYYLIDNRPDPSRVHLPSLIVHELGHILGLDHNNVSDSIMNKNLKNGVNRTTIRRKDILNLLCEYPKETHNN